MPMAIFKCVREVSSADEVHPADNLLKMQHGNKWKTKSVGEKSAYVILELNEPSQIVGIDIGNEHSAFVEVLVGKAGCSHGNFTEILLTSSFMTPIESKNSSIPNRVRCFNQEALVSSASCLKWEVLKIVCSQPFNKNVQYGLSFIKVHVLNNAPIQKDVTEEKLLSHKVLRDVSSGNRKISSTNLLKLREESPDSESESSSALFQRWKTSRNSNESQTTTTAAAIREASNLVARKRLSDCVPKLQKVTGTTLNSSSETNTREVFDRNRADLAYKKEDISDGINNGKLLKRIESDQARLDSQKQKPNQNSVVNESAEKNVITSKPCADKDNIEKQTKKRSSSPSSKVIKKFKPDKTTQQYRPFNKLLHGVVLVISGIQNPDRADIRNKALALGAKYKPDWEKGCTHLICAFKNTPKYNQVKGKGKIVSRSWIEDCFSQRKYLPWRRYTLNNSDLSQKESDEEILEESCKSSSTDIISCSPVSYGSTEDTAFNATGSDTDDDIQKIIEKNSSPKDCKQNLVKDSSKVDVFEVTTDEEDYLKDKLQSKPKCELFFEKMNFYICDSIGATDKIKLETFILKFGGCIIDDLSDAHYAVSNIALDVKFTGRTVRPLWIFECNDLKKIIPLKRYLI